MTRCQAISETCTKPSMPPTSTKAPKVARRRTSPAMTCPTASFSRAAASDTRRCASSNARRENTARCFSRSTSIGSASNVLPTYGDKSSTNEESIWEAGIKHRIPNTPTESPPFTAAVTVTSRGCPSFIDSSIRSHANRRSACTLDNWTVPSAVSGSITSTFSNCPTATTSWASRGAGQASSDNAMTPSAFWPISTNTRSFLTPTTFPAKTVPCSRRSCVSRFTCVMFSILCFTSSIIQSGVEAPAVIPALFTPKNHSGSSSAAVSTWYVGAPAFRQTSAKCLVLALFRPPTTTIASTRPASSIAAFCRSSVARQIVGLTSGSISNCLNAAKISSKTSLSSVVCDTIPTVRSNTIPVMSDAFSTATAPGPAHSKILFTSGWLRSPATTT